MALSGEEMHSHCSLVQSLAQSVPQDIPPQHHAGQADGKEQAAGDQVFGKSCHEKLKWQLGPGSGAQAQA